jgi:hypothetical protein
VLNCVERGPIVTRVNHYLSDRQADQLRLLSESSGLGMSELIRRAIDLYFQTLPHENAVGRQALERNNNSLTTELITGGERHS